MARIKLVIDNSTPPAPVRQPRMRHTEIAVTFEGLIIVMLAIRVAAHFALPQPLASDALAYFDIARSLAAGGWPTDNFGQHAFYSIGYPLLLAPAFALFGASTGVAFAVNLGLAVVSVLLIAALARALALTRMGEQLAMLGYAVWLPGIWNGTTLARENLSTPLVLAIVLLAVKLGSGPRWRVALGAGMAWGAAVLAGTSAAPLIAAPLLGLALGAGWRPVRMALPLVAMLAGAALVLTPWLAASDAMVGRPVITTNTGFNLYLGNNPAATGGFVSIAETPMGPQWHALLATQGEAGAAATLGRAAQGWMRAHPAQALTLDAHKLALFWRPNLPQWSDFTGGSRAIAIVRIGEVTEYLAIVLLGIAALLEGPVARRWRVLVAVAIVGFWALHGLAYIIPRYRDPVMPLLIVMAAGGIAAFIQRRRDKDAADAA